MEAFTVKSANKGIFTTPLFVMSILLIGLLVLATFTLVRGFDLKSMKREQELLANGVASRVAEVGRIVTPQVVWADAVRHLDNRFDPAWAEVNILSYLQETGEFDTVFILDQNDNLLIGGEDGKIVGHKRFAEFEGQVEPLVAKVRQAEIVRAAAAKRTTGVIKTPIFSVAIIAVGGKPMVVTASRVQPDHIDTKLRGTHGPIVLAAMLTCSPEM